MPPPRHFFLSLTGHRDYLSHRLSTMKPSFLELLGIGNFQPVTHEDAGPFFTFGMINTLNGQKATSECILADIEDGRENFVRLNLKELPRFSLYNGMVAAIKGRTLKPGELTVEAIYPLPTQDFNAKLKQQLDIVVARGTFDNAALDRIFEINSPVVVLLGPFISLGNSEFASFDAFTEAVETKNRKVANRRVIIVPSVEDYHAVCAYPQPPVYCRHESIISASNPRYLSINNHYVLINNLDVLFELSSNEFYRGSACQDDVLFAGDRNKRLVFYLTFQGTAMPVFPSQFNVSYGTSLDIAVSPDLYVTSSKFKGFSSTVGTSCFVNVGASNKQAHRIVYSIHSSSYDISTIDL